jgi:hypothetical protein
MAGSMASKVAGMAMSVSMSISSIEINNVLAKAIQACGVAKY